MNRFSKGHYIGPKRHIVLRTTYYIFLLLLSVVLFVFIIKNSQNNEPAYLITMIGIWCFFLFFCCYKIYRIRNYKGVFRKGVLSVGELDDMDGIAFEELACDILLANGFELAENTPASNDYGVDILAVKDGMSYAIQCKRYHGPVGPGAIQQVYAGRAYYECHVAVVLTNQTFTANARHLAEKIGVVLWDRDTLRNLL